jgi:branched-chain amino acid transport system ATP-binding protein
MLNLNNISAGYSGAPVVSDINITVNLGEIVTLIGANGAGKSTILRTLSGIITPVSGSILFNNIDITGKAIHKIVQNGIIHIPEGRKIFAGLTVRENLIMGSYTHNHIDKTQLDLIYHLFPILKKRYNQLGGTLSGGEQQMLAIGRGLIAKPKLLLLDEPSLGLAPIITQQLFKIITTINQTQQITILLVEQNSSLALKIANRGYVISNGKIILADSSEKLLNSPQVKDAYL